MTMSDQIAARVAKVRAKMAEAELPALLVTQIENVGWLTGFTGSNGFVLLTQESAKFATDSRYTEQAKEQCAGFEPVHLPTSSPEEIAGILQQVGQPKIGFEAQYMTYASFQSYTEKLEGKAELVPTKGIIDDLRLVKDAGEIALLRQACALTDRCFDHILPFLKPGAVERDVMLEMEWFMRKELEAEVGFPTIVASGWRSALPHAKPTKKNLEMGNFVTLDFGVRYQGYCADITRTVLLGQPTDEQRKVYGVVLDTLKRSIDRLVPGANGKEIHEGAEKIIGDAGYGQYFGHGLGHSLGKAVHDGQGMSRRSEVTMAAGMVMTVEPGIYIPGWGGVRVEDDVLVTASGPEVLTHAPRDLTIL